MKRKTNYTNESLGRLKVIKDFLPAPDKLIFKEEPIKVTMVLSKSSVQFFKKTARKQHAPYQKLIRTLLDTYVALYAA
jgi:predicted DNA binding CopG/RHH family protein